MKINTCVCLIHLLIDAVNVCNNFVPLFCESLWFHVCVYGIYSLHMRLMKKKLV